MSGYITVVRRRTIEDSDVQGAIWRVLDAQGTPGQQTAIETLKAVLSGQPIGSARKHNYGKQPF